MTQHQMDLANRKKEEAELGDVINESIRQTLREWGRTTFADILEVGLRQRLKSLPILADNSPGPGK